MNSTYVSDSNRSTLSMTKVFGWMFYAVAITFLAAFGLPFLLVALNAASLYGNILMVSAIAVIILSFIGQFVIMKTQSKALAVGVFTLFSLSMGVMISSLVLMYDIGSIVQALGVTALVFGVMALYGMITKRDLSGFGSFMLMLLIGSLVLSIVNIFVASQALDWILSYVILAVYIGFIAFDIQRIKKASLRGELTTNIALIFALNLYIDFIYIFIRLLAIIGSSRRN